MVAMLIQKRPGVSQVVKLTLIDYSWIRKRVLSREDWWEQLRFSREWLAVAVWNHGGCTGMG